MRVGEDEFIHSDLFDAVPGADGDACRDGVLAAGVVVGGHVDDQEEHLDGEGDVSGGVCDFTRVLEVEWVLGVEEKGV